VNAPERSRTPLCVLKLGGSLARAAELPHWLSTCAGLGGRLVVVPGGGPYADAVRGVQALWEFPDARAHAMALSAMELYAQQLCAMESRLVTAASRETIRQVLSDGGVPVWLPRAMVLADAGIPQNWSATSDSLAAWLAVRLAARLLILVKRIEAGSGDFAALAAAGVVDTAFPSFAARVPAVRIVHAGAWPLLPGLIGDDARSH
jgi:aspartokinase-like uncharacterized kinase